jgi:hypothetical protein
MTIERLTLARRQLLPHFGNEPQNLLEHMPWDSDFGHLAGELAAAARQLATDLDQLFLQARQQPILDRLRRRLDAQNIAEIVGQRMKLKPHRGCVQKRPMAKGQLDCFFGV